MRKIKTIEELDAEAREVLQQLRADDREVEMFLGNDEEEAEAAAFLIGSRVGHKLGSTAKAHHTIALLGGLRSELTNLRRISREMLVVATYAVNTVSGKAVAPAKHAGAEGTSEDPRAPGDYDNICDVCNYERGLRGGPNASTATHE